MALLPDHPPVAAIFRPGAGDDQVEPAAILDRRLDAVGEPDPLGAALQRVEEAVASR